MQGGQGGGAERQPFLQQLSTELKMLGQLPAQPKAILQKASNALLHCHFLIQHLLLLHQLLLLHVCFGLHPSGFKLGLPSP